MELISVYLFSRSPIAVQNIIPETFQRLKSINWYTDPKSNEKYVMLNKRIDFGNEWYRVMIRFKKEDDNNYTLSNPTPFIISRCEPITSITTSRWRDTSSYHGLKLGISGFIEQGIPAGVIEEVHEDLHAHVVYTH